TALQTYADQAETDAVAAAVAADATQTAALQTYADTAEADAIATAGTNSTAELEAITGDVTVSGGVSAIGAAKVTSTMMAVGSVSGGTGGTITDNSVTDADLAPQSVTASELANGAVEGGAAGDILDGSITTADLDATSLNAVYATDAEVSALTTTTIAEGSNLYYTEARVAANTDVLANTAKVTNATHTGDVTGATALTIAADAVTTGKILNGTILGEDLNIADVAAWLDAGGDPGARAVSIGLASDAALDVVDQTAQTASQEASNALGTAQQAEGSAQQALGLAQQADGTAQQAISIAVQASQDAQLASGIAQQAEGIAIQADGTAQQAAGTAQQALVSSGDNLNAIQGLTANVDNNTFTIQDHEQRITDLEFGGLARSSNAQTTSLTNVLTLEPQRTAPQNAQDGTIYFDGTNVKIKVAGVWRTVKLD
ncbi:MAG: hypothetical protein HKN96_07895, partial [Flavobacteriaceae bacterium]|nr:hypothetical protein [Flavobacteriaceae bacterium]